MLTHNCKIQTCNTEKKSQNCEIWTYKYLIFHCVEKNKKTNVRDHAEIWDKKPGFYSVVEKGYHKLYLHVYTQKQKPWDIFQNGMRVSK